MEYPLDVKVAKPGRTDVFPDLAIFLCPHLGIERKGGSRKRRCIFAPCTRCRVTPQRKEVKSMHLLRTLAIGALIGLLFLVVATTFEQPKTAHACVGCTLRGVVRVDDWDFTGPNGVYFQGKTLRLGPTSVGSVTSTRKQGRGAGNPGAFIPGDGRVIGQLAGMEQGSGFWKPYR